MTVVCHPLQTEKKHFTETRVLSDGKVTEHHSRVTKIPTQSNENVEGWKLMFWGDLHNEILAQGHQLI